MKRVVLTTYTLTNCKTFLDLEDMGFSHLLSLRDAITELIASRVTEVSQPVVAEGAVHQTSAIMDYASRMMRDSRQTTQKVRSFRVSSTSSIQDSLKTC